MRFSRIAKTQKNFSSLASCGKKAELKIPQLSPYPCPERLLLPFPSLGLISFIGTTRKFDLTKLRKNHVSCIIIFIIIFVVVSRGRCRTKSIVEYYNWWDSINNLRRSNAHWKHCINIFNTSVCGHVLLLWQRQKTTGRKFTVISK